MMRYTCKCGRETFAKICSPCRRKGFQVAHAVKVRGLNEKIRELQETIRNLKAVIADGRAF